MTRFLLPALMCCFICLTLSAQMELTLIEQSKSEKVLGLDSMMRYADFHIHPTYKHYFRDKTADMMKRILEKSSYNSSKDTLEFNSHYKDSIGKINWEQYEHPKPLKTKKPLARGKVSDLRNYDQSSYPEIMYVPGSILCNSYSPYEKQFALEESKRRISSAIVTKMGLPRLTSYSEDEHTPFKDFLAEYYYNCMQQETFFVKTALPGSLYGKDNGVYNVQPGYYNTIRMVRDSLELDSIVRKNNEVFRNWNSSMPPPTIITPLVMSIEGGQVLYSTLSSKERFILNPLNYDSPLKKDERFFSSTTNDTLKMIHDELLSTVDSLKNLHHRLFFITLGHFAQNHVVGFAKTLDRDPDNVAHRALSTITSFPKQLEKLIPKFYAGFNPGINIEDSSFTPDSIGFEIVKAFLDPNKGRFKKPTYIDVKHMDIEARIQYYHMRRKYEKQFNVKIPIVASHFGVSGENQAMAAATGLWPHFDMYKEVDRAEWFYEQNMLLNYDVKKRRKYWMEDVMGYPDTSSKLTRKYHLGEVLDRFDRGMYRPLDFYNDTLFDNRAYDPFVNYHLDDNKVDWFYPWSVNLFDEEIIEINKSNGIIGLLLDPRQLGAYMHKYKGIEKKFGRDFQKYKKAINDSDLHRHGLTRDDLISKEYFKTEPLIRNLFYIVQLILQRQFEEKHHKSTGENTAVTRLKFPDYIADEIYTEKDAWKTVAIGGDYDGLIDPIDFSPTASYIPLLRKRMIFYAWLFAQIHQDVYKHPETGAPLIKDIAESELRMHQFFYDNGQKFICQYF